MKVSSLVFHYIWSIPDSFNESVHKKSFKFWFENFRFNLEEKLAKVENLGILHQQFKIKGKWPNRYIEDFEQINSQAYTPLNYALKNKLLLTHNQWVHLIEKSNAVLPRLICDSDLPDELITLLLKKCLSSRHLFKEDAPIRTFTIHHQNRFTSSQWQYIMEHTDLKHIYFNGQTVLLDILERKLQNIFNVENICYLMRMSDVAYASHKIRTSYMLHNFNILKSCALNRELETKLVVRSEKKEKLQKV